MAIFNDCRLDDMERGGGGGMGVGVKRCSNNTHFQGEKVRQTI